MQQAQQMQEQQLQAKAEEARMKMEFEASENAKDRQARLAEAQIKAAGYGAMQDINENKQSDFMDTLDQIRQSDEFQQTANLQQQEINLKGNQHRDKMTLEQQKLQTQKDIADKQLQIAIQNKNKYDIAAKEKKKNKEK
jgi:isocitrate dehydrogenase